MGPWLIGTIALAVFAVALIGFLCWHDNHRLNKFMEQLESDLHANGPTDAEEPLRRRPL